MARQLLLPFVFVGLMFVFGCSDRQSLSGKVTFSDDGSPVPAGVVYFNTPTSVSRGAIKPDGTYAVGTDKLTDGIPKGTYAVTVRVEEAVVITLPDGSKDVEGKSLIDRKYHDTETSGLTFTADGKTKTFDIQVDRAPKE